VISAILGVTVAAFAIRLTVQIINRRKSWKCALWGIAILAFGSAIYLPTFISISATSSNPAVFPFLFCIAGFLHSYRSSPGRIGDQP
jgi:hypothetical protein